jgi:hypothetical protein
MCIPKYIILLSITIIGISCPAIAVYSQSANRVYTNIQNLSQLQEQGQPQPSPETIALRAQLEQMRTYDDRLLSTVQWTIGITVGVIVALAGLGWYSNFRAYKRDIEALKHELLIFSQQEITRIRDELEKSIDKQFTDLKTQWEKKNDTMSKMTISSIEAISKRIDSHKEVFESRLNWLEYNVVELDAKRSEENKSFVGAIHGYRKKLELSIKMQWENGIILALNDLARVLELKKDQARERLFLPETPMNPETSMEIVKLLDGLPSIYSAESKKVYGLLGVYRPEPRFPRLSRLGYSSGMSDAESDCKDEVTQGEDKKDKG